MTQYLEEFDKSLEGWTDERFVSRDDFRVLAVFGVYLVNLLEAQGTSYDGHSLNIGTPFTRLVVRATIDRVPCVAFISARTTVGCMRIFLRRLAADELEWVKDKFRS